jgi:hypothetical protein
VSKENHTYTKAIEFVIYGFKVKEFDSETKFVSGMARKLWWLEG